MTGIGPHKNKIPKEGAARQASLLVAWSFKSSRRQK
jgi:hypothetical protein